MTEDQMRALEKGDIVRNEGGGRTYVVTGNYGGRVTAVCSVDITNPPEWVLVQKARTQ